MSAKARAVVYARVSTEMQAEDQIPIIGQVEECRNFCESKGWQIVYLYKDEGLSGSTADRPGLQELLHCVRQKPREIDYVVTWKGSRLENEIANLMKVLSDGFDSVSVREAVEEREKSVVTLQKEVQAIKAKKDRYANAQLTQELIEAVHRESIQALDTEEPEKLRVILRHYIESIKVNGDSVSVKFAFQESPSSCRVMVAGVGFEPTTFGL